jgi:hypothetical protein
LIEAICKYVSREFDLGDGIIHPENLSVLIYENGYLRKPDYARLLAFIFKGDEPQPKLIAKFGRLTNHNPRINMEYQNVTTILKKAKLQIIPKPLKCELIEGRLVLFEEYKTGKNMRENLTRLVQATHGTSTLLMNQLKIDFQISERLLNLLESLYVDCSSGEVIHEFDSLAEFDRIGRNCRGYGNDHFEEVLTGSRDILWGSGLKFKQGIVNFDFSPNNILVDDDQVFLLDWEWSMNTGLTWLMPFHFVQTYLEFLYGSSLSPGIVNLLDLMKGGLGEAGEILRVFLSVHGVETQEPWLRWAQLFTYFLFERSMFIEIYEDDRFRRFEGLFEVMANEYSLLRNNYKVFDLRTANENYKNELMKIQSAFLSREKELLQIQTTLENQKNELLQVQTALENHKNELLQAQTALENRESEIFRLQTAIENRENELHLVQTTTRIQREEFDQLKNKSKLLSYELDQSRNRKVVRAVNRVLDRGDARKDLSPAFQQLQDDSAIFIAKLKSYRLQPSINLQRVPFLQYPLDLDRSNLKGILLVPILDLPLSEGILGVEIISPSNKVVCQSIISATQIDASIPTSLEFSPITDSDQGRFWLRVFVREVDGPIRIFEWRKYSGFGFGPVQTRGFNGLLFQNA